MVGELGQGFGRAYAHTYRQAGPLANALAHLPPQGHAATVQRQHLLDAQKAFIDAVDLKVGCVVTQDVHHPLAHVGVQGVVGRKRFDAMQQRQIFQRKPRCAHLHAQRFDLVGASHRAAIVVGEHHHGDVVQARLKYAFTADVEVVHINQRKLCGCVHA